MDRIKNVKDVILRPDSMLVEIVEVSSIIIIPGESKDAIDYFVVVAKGTGVTDIEIGDYLLDLTTMEVGVYVINNKKYAIVYRGNVRIAVKADNFDLNKKTSSGLIS